jgi:hypothetical protein
MNEAVDHNSIVTVVAVSQWVWSRADKTWVNDKAEDGGDFCDKRDVAAQRGNANGREHTNPFIQEANNLKRG